MTSFKINEQDRASRSALLALQRPQLPVEVGSFRKLHQLPARICTPTCPIAKIFCCERADKYFRWKAVKGGTNFRKQLLELQNTPQSSRRSRYCLFVLQLESLPIEESLARFTRDPCWWRLFWAKVNDYHNTLNAKRCSKGKNASRKGAESCHCRAGEVRACGKLWVQPPALHNSSVVVYL